MYHSTYHSAYHSTYHSASYRDISERASWALSARKVLDTQDFEACVCDVNLRSIGTASVREVSQNASHGIRWLRGGGAPPPLSANFFPRSLRGGPGGIP